MKNQLPSIAIGGLNYQRALDRLSPKLIGRILGMPVYADPTLRPGEWKLIAPEAPDALDGQETK